MGTCKARRSSRFDWKPATATRFACTSPKRTPCWAIRVYQPDLAQHPRWPYKRLALHARLLGFSIPYQTRPATRKPVTSRNGAILPGREASIMIG